MNNSNFKLSFLIALIVLSGCKTEDKIPDPLEAGWKGEKVCEVIEENDEIRILKCTFPPGVGHDEHQHQPHYGYTLKGGKFLMNEVTGSREVDVPTGYYFSKDSITVHNVLNIGDSTSVFLIIESK